jgi:hypothetical protein
MVSGLEVAGIAVGSIGVLVLLKWFGKKSLNTGQDTSYGSESGGTRRNRRRSKNTRKNYRSN